MKNNKYSYYLEELQDVQLVMNIALFIYLDILLLSFFLGFILYSQMNVWLIPTLVSGAVFIFFTFVFYFFFKDHSS